MPSNIYAGVGDDCDAAERFDLRSTSAEHVFGTAIQ
jgi:hypothetical protein